MPYQHDDVEIWHINRTDLRECSAAPTTDHADLPEAQALPLVVREPMRVRFGDHAVTLEEQGLYMFHGRGRLEWDEPGARPRVLQRAHTDTSVIYFRDDLSALFAGLATLHVHGWVQNELGAQERIETMKHGLVSCTCGAIAEIAIHLLQSFGYRARPVGALHVRGRYNARDDGHALMECFDPQRKQWVLVDLDTHSTFAWQGRPLSLGQVTDCIHANQRFEIVPITPPGFAIPDTTGHVAPETGPTYMTFKLLSAPHLRQWFEQMFEVPMMPADGQRWFWHPDDELAARATDYNPEARRLSREAWWSRFYPDQPISDDPLHESLP